MDLRAVLFDLDGVIWEGGRPIDGARATVDWARARGLPFRFVTNTTSRGRDALVERLARCGIEASPGDVWTPLAAAAAWLSTQEAGPVAAFVEEAARSELAGFELLPADAESGARYVVVGDLAEGWDHATLTRAFRLLHADPATRLVALGMTRYWSTPDGLSLDVGPYVAALAYAAGTDPVVLGKPGVAFFLAGAADLGAPHANVLMIGDDVVTDIGGAQEAGLRGALVRTGKFRQADLRAGVEPDVVLDSVAALPRWWEENVP